MTEDEQNIHGAYLVDAGDIDPDAGDVEDQFWSRHEVRQGVVSGETHYKAVLEAARVRKRSFDRGCRRMGRRGPAPGGRPTGRLRPRRSLWLLRRKVRGRQGRGQSPAV